MAPCRRLVLACAIGLAAFVSLPASASDGEFKNLKVLPGDISRDRLKSIMKAQAKALGVECDHCHDMPDAAKDTKNKEVARQMLRMTDEINQKFLKDMKEKVTCATCHRGKEKPDVGRR